MMDRNGLMLVNGEEQEMDALSEALASAMVSNDDNENSDGDTGRTANTVPIVSTYASRMTAPRTDPAWSQLRSMITDMTEDDEVTMMEVDALMDAHDEMVRCHALRFTRDELRLVHILFDSVYNAIDDNVEDAFLSVLSTLRPDSIDTVLAGESEPEMERHGDPQAGQTLAGTVKTLRTVGTMSTSGSSDDRVMPRASTMSPIMSPLLSTSMPATVHSSAARRLGKPRKIRLLRPRAMGTGVSASVSTRMGTVDGTVSSTNVHTRATASGKTGIVPSLSVPRLVLNTGDNAIHDCARDSIHSAHGLMMRKR